MRAVVRVFDQDFRSRRSIADAVDLLARQAAFRSSDCARIEAYPLALPWEEVGWLLCLVFETDQEWLYVPLPCSSKFRAIRDGSSRREIFQTSSLARASVDGACRITLTDGTGLRAVEILPSIATLNPSDLDYFIVHALIKFNNAEDWCYQDFSEFLPAERREGLPQLRMLNFRRLPELEIPGLKQVIGFIADTRPDLLPISEQKVSDALRRFGLRIPEHRPRNALKPTR